MSYPPLGRGHTAFDTLLSLFTLGTIIDIGVEGLETGSRERIVTIHFRVQTPCCARKAKFLPSLSPVDCVSCSVTGFHSC